MSDMRAESMKQNSVNIKMISVFSSVSLHLLKPHKLTFKFSVIFVDLSCIFKCKNPDLTPKAAVYLCGSSVFTYAGDFMALFEL